MKVRIEDAGPCRKVMHVDVPPDGVVPEYESVVKEYVKFGRVPGFRPGKAPATVVERHYAKGIADETKDRLVPKCYREALKENRVSAVAIVDVQNVKMEKAKGLTFSVTLDIAPEFKLPKYKKIVLKENPVRVDDKDVDTAFHRLLDGYAKFEDTAERPVKEGDLVQIDYQGRCDGKTVTEIAPESAGLGEGKDFWVLCGDREFLPGFNAGLLGAAINEKREIKVRFPTDYQAKTLAGKDATYGVLIKAIRQKVLPEITPEFLKPFDVESQEQLREKIKKDMVVHAEKAEKDREKAEIATFLLKETEFDLPVSVVEQETNMAVRTMVERFARQGATREQIVERRDDIVNAASRSSKDRVKLSYILSRIATEEKMDVADDEVKARVESLAKQYDMPVEKLAAELEKRNGVEGLRSDIRSEKAMDFLLENAKKK